MGANEKMNDNITIAFLGGLVVGAAIMTATRLLASLLDEIKELREETKEQMRKYKNNKIDE